MSKGFVYVLGPWGFRYVKIGFTDKPRKRLSTLQIGNHEELVFWSIMVAERADEPALHDRFARYHERGEWFCNTGDLQTYLKDLANEPADVVVFHRKRGDILPRGLQ